MFWPEPIPRSNLNIKTADEFDCTDLLLIDSKDKPYDVSGTAAARWLSSRGQPNVLTTSQSIESLTLQSRYQEYGHVNSLSVASGVAIWRSVHI